MIRSTRAGGREIQLAFENSFLSVRIMSCRDNRSTSFAYISPKAAPQRQSAMQAKAAADGCSSEAQTYHDLGGRAPIHFGSECPVLWKSGKSLPAFTLGVILAWRYSGLLCAQ